MTENILKENLYRIILLAMAVVFCLAAFSGGLINQYGRWMSQEEYSHGFLIPLISLWMLWDRRDALGKSIDNPSWMGLILILLAFFMLLVGELSAIFILVQTGFIVSLIGMCLAFGGIPFLRLTFLPIAFLAFAIPMPYFLDTILSWRLQLVSSELGVFFIRLFNIPVFLEGNVIDLGTYKLQVVDACSGLRYLYPLSSLGFLVAYLFKAPFWQRVIVFLSTIPITILMNSFRIGMVGVLVEIWGGGMADGLLHYFEGWVIFMACAAMLCGEVWIFTKFGKRGDFFELFDLPEVTAQKVSSVKTDKPLLPISVIGVFMVVAMITTFNITDRVENKPDRDRFVSFPKDINNWKSKKLFLDTGIEQALGFDDYILADYRIPQIDQGPALLQSRPVNSIQQTMPVNFYVAYYSSQRKGVSPHSPRVCIPGGGWLITEFDRLEIELANGTQTLPINRAIIERDSSRQLVYYWFDQRGRKISNEYLMKWHLVKDAIFMNRTDGALVRVTTPIFDGEEINVAEDRLKLFIDSIAPNLPDYLPG